MGLVPYMELQEGSIKFMQIYDLDNIITLSALSPYKSAWLKMDLLSCTKHIVEGTDFFFDWDEGIENWIVFFHKNKIVGYLCTRLPFAIISNEQLKNRIYQIFPHVQILKIQNFETDKVSLNANICKLVFGATYHCDSTAQSLQDFYVSTVT